MYKILFVCLGNICRSPTAEGIMKSLVKARGLEDNFYIDSAGISAWHQGESPDFRSSACAKSFGVDISQQKSRQLSVEDFSQFDLILGMDLQNLEDIKSMSQRAKTTAKIDRLLSYASDYGESVPDPYYNNGFDRVFEMISVACGNLLDEIEKNLTQSPVPC